MKYANFNSKNIYLSAESNDMQDNFCNFAHKLNIFDMNRRLFLLLVLILGTTIVEAKLKLASLLTDNMVLQQQSDARLWGEASPGAKITVTTSWNKKAVYTAVADGQGEWKVSVKTPAASYESYSVTISEGKESITLNGILIGEVWLASGQSNMEMPLKGFAGCCVENGVGDAMKAHQESPYVRMFTVKKAQNMHVQKECEGTWNEPTFKNALEFSATAYYFASALSNALQVPVGIVNSSYGGAHVESWASKEVCEKYSDIPLDSAQIYKLGDWDRPMLMYNAMFAPVKNYTYKGIIWYQGCSNIGHADVYAQRLADMVSLWRKDIGLGELPFYQVELAPYIFGKDENDTLGALLRESQMKATEIIPNCEIVCTNDLALPLEVHNIHPSRKRPVGQRLSYIALNKVYGWNEVPVSGPRYDKSKFRIEGNKAIVGFITNQFGICRNWGLEGFEIAGEDKMFHKANVEFHWQTNEVFLTADEVPAPVAVRYCFKDFQVGNMIGGYELPLFPFRTDNW